MKKHVILLFVALIFSQAAYAYYFCETSPSGHLLYYEVLSNGTVSVFVSTPNTITGDLIIPDSVVNNDTTYIVTAISDFGFNNCHQLTSVTIPNSVTIIGAHAFHSCGITSVTIPNSVTAIGQGAFSICRYLISVTIPNSVTAIEESTFASCEHLTSVTIPNSVTTIGESAFSGCSSLSSVSIPNSVTDIGKRAFNGCDQLTSVTIGNSVNQIKEYAFRNCQHLTTIIFNATQCTNAGGLYHEDNWVENETHRAFYGCTNVTSFIFGDSVSIIPSYLCYGMTSLTSITFPASVNSVRKKVISGCYGLREVSFLNPTPPGFGDDALAGAAASMAVNVPCGSLALYAPLLPYITIFNEQYVGFAAISDDENKGTVQILTEPSCTNPNAVLYAVPSDGYRFDHWSTGSTDNPYTLAVSTDTTIIAYFVSSGTQGIGEVEEDDIHINVFNGRICVEGITNEEVRVYDITGRMVQNHSLPSGVYIVKVGTLPAQKVVVMR